MAAGQHRRRHRRRRRTGRDRQRGARLAIWPPESLGAALCAIDSVLSALDRQASRFREESEIAWVHRRGGGRFMLSSRLAEAGSVALEAARWTGGPADPTVGGALISLGYDRDFAAIDPERGRPAGAPVPAPGWQTVRLDGPVLSLPAGVRLDLGATAKGLGSDRTVRAVISAAGQAGGGACQPRRRHRRCRPTAAMTAGRSWWPTGLRIEPLP